MSYPVKTRFSVAANTVIFNEKGEVLLCHRTDKDRWNFPGGSMESGETPEQAAMREAKEEVGVEANDIKYFPVNALPENISSYQVERILDATSQPQHVLLKTQIKK